MEIPAEINSCWKLTTTIVFLLLFEQSSSHREKVVFVLQERGSVKNSNVVVIVTRRNEEAVACETSTDVKYSPNANHVLKSLTEEEMQNVLKECDTLSKSRQRRQAKRRDTKNCTGAGYNAKNCTGRGFGAKNCTGAGCDANNCTENGCDVKNCTGAGCDAKNGTAAGCDAKNCTGAGCDAKNCTGKGCDAKNCTVKGYDSRDCSDESCDANDCGGAGCGEEDCDDGSCENEGDEESSDEGESMWNIIFPGTLWCGSGQTAKTFDELGFLKNTDQCCRSHDNCNDTMAPGETKHNLTNKSRFTALSCACDNEFYDCLYNVSSVVSNTIGRTYFNILRRSCYTKDHPQSNVCKTYRSFLKITCKEYEKNTSVPEMYVWKSPKRYKKLPIPIVG